MARRLADLVEKGKRKQPCASAGGVYVERVGSRCSVALRVQTHGFGILKGRAWGGAHIYIYVIPVKRRITEKLGKIIDKRMPYIQFIS